jgi:hypothetical protein
MLWIPAFAGMTKIFFLGILCVSAVKKWGKTHIAFSCGAGL